MPNTKQHIHVPIVDLKYESEIVENRIKSLFPNKNICGVLYHTLNSADSKKTKIEKISHYQMAQGLYEGITHIDDFFSGKRTFNSCNRGNFIDNLWKNVLISVFTSYKENFIGKKGNSWANWLDRIKNEDLAKLDIRNRVNIKNAPADKISSDRWIISEIRNALNHPKYIVIGDTLHVKNPQTGFEAEVPLKLLYDFTYLVTEKVRKVPAYGIDVDDKSVYYPNNYKFDDIKDKVHYYISVDSTKDNPAHIRNFEENKKFNQLGKKGIVEIDRKDKEIQFTDKLENLAKTYFNENGKNKRRKGHKIDYKNLKYIGMNLLAPPEGYMWCFLERIKKKINRGDSKFYSHEIVDEFGIYVNDTFGDPAFRRGDSDPEIAELVEFEKKLRSQKLGNGDSILRQLGACIKFAEQYFINRGYKSIIKIEDRKKVLYFRLGNTEIKYSNIIDVCGALNGYYFASCQIAESFPDWLKIQFIESVYVNELITLQNNNVPGLVGLGTRDPDDKFTNREHIRNALVHNNYTMLHGVDEIVLRDGYNKNTDTWEREEIVNLPKLYEETYKEMSNNMSKESNLEIMLDKNSFSNY